MLMKCHADVNVSKDDIKKDKRSLGGNNKSVYTNLTDIKLKKACHYQTIYCKKIYAWVCI